MNVALVHRRYTEHGGTERFVVGLARHLLQRGHEVHVYCNEIREDLVQDGPVFHHLPMLRPAKVLSLYRSSIAASGGGHQVVMGFGRTRGHQIFRCGGGAHQAYLEACKPKWKANPQAWLERSVDREAVLSAKTVVSPSRQAADDLVRCYGADPERIQVLPNGVDSARFRPNAEARLARRRELGLDPQAKVLGFLGTGFERKGLAVAAEVAREVGLDLVVMGADHRFDMWLRRNHDLHFVGPVRAPEDWLPAVDVLLLPTSYEPYGNVCLEAMACGVVPVTTPWNGVSEVFPIQGLTGGNHAELVAALHTALKGGAELSRMCIQAARAMPRERTYAALEQLLLQEAMA